MADAVYWPSSLSRSIKRKKERGQYSAILAEQVWSIKNLLYGKKESTGNPKQARWAHLAHSRIPPCNKYQYLPSLLTT